MKVPLNSIQLYSLKMHSMKVMVVSESSSRNHPTHQNPIERAGAAVRHAPRNRSQGRAAQTCAGTAACVLDKSQRLCMSKRFEPGTHLAATARKEQHRLALAQQLASSTRLRDCAC